MDLVFAFSVVSERPLPIYRRSKAQLSCLNFVGR